ncbi:hypothetical protein KIY80_gp74 [Mycobacterium phage Benvolio]|uniref:Uncharacterized protein n=1 Tax=Mycobacterium phage Benvolio TaxID=2591074 RepID=A0A514A3P4_9CAUD|nr:hypothetical protein CH13_gp077 [Mycobacterium phage Echild]YP_010063511.1 hypothetical protein KIY80_gp74 [Mycobacterium phage Benvolio]AHG24298.1 hypothetical protein PBI_ECHILD_77 [Mycobacterium phage Echild]QDH47890.1 hypothetical protein SEA_BENVOLIO_74 [Mycobacterium phage Benvolio]
MYVDDVDDLEELEYLRDEAQARVDSGTYTEQAQWDLEDIEARIEELSAEVGGLPG